MKAIYSPKSYKVMTLTIAEATRMIDLGALPAMQAARGKVWPADVRTRLVKDAAAGLYIPPVVLVGDKDSNALSDGQQRLTTLAEAFKSGKLDGDIVLLLVVDLVRTIEESFSALNVGVPVGQALVAAMSTPEATREGILKLASHPYLASGRKWTDAQKRKTSTAEFAAAALAIASGWKNPESSTKECTKYLGTYTATQDVIDKAYNALTALNLALVPINAGAQEKKGDIGKLYRACLAETRKKSVFMTVASAIMDDEANARRAVRAVCHGDKWLVPVKVKGVGECRWAVGGGTSGGASDYRERKYVMTDAVERMKAAAPGASERKEMPPTDADKAVLDAGSADPDAIAAALFDTAGGADNA